MSKAMLRASACLFLYVSAVAQGIPPSAVPHLPSTGQYPSHYWDWTKEVWTGDDRPYQQILEEINHAFATRALSESMVQDFARQHQNAPQDPQALFRWAYSLYQGEQMHPRLSVNGVPGDGAFSQIPSPHSYLFARIRFLNAARFGPHEPELIRVGKRLLKKRPNDDDVEYYLIQCFRPGQSVQDSQDALYYAQDLERKYPKRPSTYAALGNVHFSRWVGKWNPDEAKQAMAAYQKYLKLAPVGYEGRISVMKQINLLQRRMQKT